MLKSLCSESVYMLSIYSHWAPKVKRRQIANLIKREEKFVAVVEHSLSNYVTIFIHLHNTCHLLLI